MELADLLKILTEWGDVGVLPIYYKNHKPGMLKFMYDGKTIILRGLPSEDFIYIGELDSKDYAYKIQEII